MLIVTARPDGHTAPRPPSLASKRRLLDSDPCRITTNGETPAGRSPMEDDIRDLLEGRAEEDQNYTFAPPPDNRRRPSQQTNSAPSVSRHPTTCSRPSSGWVNQASSLNDISSPRSIPTDPTSLQPSPPISGIEGVVVSPQAGMASGPSAPGHGPPSPTDQHREQTQSEEDCKESSVSFFQKSTPARRLSDCSSQLYGIGSHVQDNDSLLWLSSSGARYLDISAAFEDEPCSGTDQTEPVAHSRPLEDCTLV